MIGAGKIYCSDTILLQKRGNNGTVPRGSISGFGGMPQESLELKWYILVNLAQNILRPVLFSMIGAGTLSLGGKCFLENFKIQCIWHKHIKIGKCADNIDIREGILRNLELYFFTYDFIPPHSKL